MKVEESLGVSAPGGQLSRAEFGTFRGVLCLLMKFPACQGIALGCRVPWGFDDRTYTASQTLPACPPELSSLQKVELLLAQGSRSRSQEEERTRLP